MQRIEGSGEHRGVPACFPEGDSTRTSGLEGYEVKRGDTLSKLADQLRAHGQPGTRTEIVALLLKLNPQIADKNLIEVGQVLRLPSPSIQERRTTAANIVEQHVERLFSQALEPESRPTTAGDAVSAGVLALIGPHSGTVYPRASGTTFPTSPDGTPIYNQADAAWGKNTLGTEDRSIQSKGCAMTSTAMVLSKLTGKAITPEVLDKYLDEHGGYQGNSIVWSKAAECAGAGISATRADWDIATIDSELEAGRAVVVGVHYRKETAETTTDHWIAITRKDPDDDNIYWGNDPAGGKEIRLKLSDAGALEAADPKEKPYKTTGRLITFSPTEAV